MTEVVKVTVDSENEAIRKFVTVLLAEVFHNLAEKTVVNGKQYSSPVIDEDDTETEEGFNELVESTVILNYGISK